MRYIFVNLKRFEIPRSMDGVCPFDDPVQWIEDVIDQSIIGGLGCLQNVQLIYLLPESLLFIAIHKMNSYPLSLRKYLSIGCQGVHWDDVKAGENFGAFTTVFPAKAAAAIGCQWSIIGHSEERRFKSQIMAAYNPAIIDDPESMSRAKKAVDELINAEVIAALKCHLRVLLCIGESTEERGTGSFEEMKPRISSILYQQLARSLNDYQNAADRCEVVIGYEPIWAIGPGKTPPDQEYIHFVSSFIKQSATELFGAPVAVVYGGGLKESNAAMINSISTIDGGLVALTQFTGEIGFHVSDLKKIIEQSIQHERD